MPLFNGFRILEMSDEDKKKEKKTDEEIAKKKKEDAAEVRRLRNTPLMKKRRIERVKKNRAMKKWQRDNT